MNPISEHQYQQILLFMQEHNIATFQQAQEKYHNPYLHTDRPQVSNNHYSWQQIEPPQSLHEEQQMEEINNKELAIKFQQHLIKKNNNQSGLFARMFYGIQWFVYNFFKRFACLFLPKFILNRWFRNEFYRIYFNRIRWPILQTKLQQLLKSTKSTGQKSVMLVISQQKQQQNLTNFLNNPSISILIKQKFLFYGSTTNQSQLNIIQNINIEGQIIFVRMNVFDEIVIIQRIKLSQINSLTQQKLQQIHRNGLNIMRHDKNVIIKYTNYKNKLMGNQIQESQYSEIDYQANRRLREQIQHQNQEYQMIEQHKADEMEKQIYREKIYAGENEEDRDMVKEMKRIRWQSFPKQPKEGNFVTIGFRCPDGKNIFRNFPSNSKVDDLFIWVQLNDDIKFEGNSGFDILFNYPLRSLSDDRQKQIGQVLTSNQKVIIQQL